MEKICVVCETREVPKHGSKYCELCRFIVFNNQLKKSRLSIGDPVLDAKEKIKGDKWIYESNANCDIISIKKDCIRVLYHDIIPLEFEYTFLEWYKLKRIKRKKRFYCNRCKYWKIRRYKDQEEMVCSIYLGIEKCKTQGRKVYV